MAQESKVQKSQWTTSLMVQSNPKVSSSNLLTGTCLLYWLSAVILGQETEKRRRKKKKRWNGFWTKKSVMKRKENQGPKEPGPLWSPRTASECHKSSGWLRVLWWCINVWYLLEDLTAYSPHLGLVPFRSWRTFGLNFRKTSASGKSSMEGRRRNHHGSLQWEVQGQAEKSSCRSGSGPVTILGPDTVQWLVGRPTVIRKVQGEAQAQQCSSSADLKERRGATWKGAECSRLSSV